MFYISLIRINKLIRQQIFIDGEIIWLNKNKLEMLAVVTFRHHSYIP